MLHIKKLFGIALCVILGLIVLFSLKDKTTPIDMDAVYHDVVIELEHFIETYNSSTLGYDYEYFDRDNVDDYKWIRLLKRFHTHDNSQLLIIERRTNSVDDGVIGYTLERVRRDSSDKWHYRVEASKYFDGELIESSTYSITDISELESALAPFMRRLEEAKIYRIDTITNNG